MNQQITGKLISRKRKEKNLTQEQLAEKLGVSNKTVSKWENGRCMPDYSVIEKLCRELDITVAELLFGEKAENETDGEKYGLLLYRIQQAEDKNKSSMPQKLKSGIGFGCALAMIISYVNWQSVIWAVIHGLLGWVYVVYYVIRY